jgi:hypothetical protein
MAKITTVVAFVAAGAFGAALAAAVMAAPAPAGKASDRWEYAEAQFRGIPKGFGERVQQYTAHWVTAEGDVKADTWKDLAEKLKAPAAKKAATEESHRLRVFNRLAADGWEFVGDRPGHRSKAGELETEAWLFRRKVAK